MLCPRFREVRFLESGDLDDDPGGRSWHGRVLRRFRRRALDLVAAGKTVAEVARLLEVSDQSIYTWRRQELIDRGELPGLSSEEREELRAARLRIRELETELAVHRRAAELLKESVRPKGDSRRSQ
jgi:transposase